MVQSKCGSLTLKYPKSRYILRVERNKLFRTMTNAIFWTRGFGILRELEGLVQDFSVHPIVIVQVRNGMAFRRQK